MHATDQSIETIIDLPGRGVHLAVRGFGAGRPFLWGHGLMGSIEQEDVMAGDRESLLAEPSKYLAKLAREATP